LKLQSLVVKLFSLEKKLPHQRMRKDNLERIHRAGLEAWLAEQDKEWRCPKCQTPYSWYQSVCDSCGTGLDPLKGFLSKD
jgi:rubrerythrin